MSTFKNIVSFKYNELALQNRVCEQPKKWWQELLDFIVQNGFTRFTVTIIETRKLFVVLSFEFTNASSSFRWVVVSYRIRKVRLVWYCENGILSRHRQRRIDHTTGERNGFPKTVLSAGPPTYIYTRSMPPLLNTINNGKKAMWPSFSPIMFREPWELEKKHVSFYCTYNIAITCI